MTTNTADVLTVDLRKFALDAERDWMFEDLDRIDAELERLRAVEAAAQDHGICVCAGLTGGEGPRPIGGGRFYHYQGCDNDPALRAVLTAKPSPSEGQGS